MAKLKRKKIPPPLSFHQGGFFLSPYFLRPISSSWEDDSGWAEHNAAQARTPSELSALLPLPDPSHGFFLCFPHRVVHNGGLRYRSWKRILGVADQTAIADQIPAKGGPAKASSTPASLPLDPARWAPPPPYAPFSSLLRKWPCQNRKCRCPP
jgi:hypothetical protein